MDMIDPLPEWAYAIALLLLLFGSMFFSASETAVLAISKLRVKYLAALKNKRAHRIEKILLEKRRFLSTMLIGNNIVNILISVLLTELSLRLFGPAGLGVAVAVATVLVLIFGETTPKSLALAFPERLSLYASGLIRIAMIVLYPAERLFSGITAKILPLIGIKTQNTQTKVTEADLEDFFETRKEQGLIDEDERRVLSKILQYEDFLVRDIMIPRTDIAAVHIEMSAAEIIGLSQKSRFSRFPVYDKDIDDIKGFFYIKDFLFSDSFFNFENEVLDTFIIRDYLREPLFVFEGLSASAAQGLLHSHKQSIAIVIDEYGGTSGVISMVDINEEILGALDDEHDIPSEESRITRDISEFGKAVVSGAYRLSDINRDLHVTLSSEYNNTTIGGYIMEQLDDIPIEGASIQIDGFTIVVTEIKKTRITAVEISVLKESS